ncbi:MAG: efflux RND transporter periplasmic adaptor subunit [Vicinamibacterales bacterium]
MRRALVSLVVLALAGAGGYAYYRYRQRPQPPAITTAVVTRGDVVETVGAAGTLQAVTTVQVGTQVSGTVQELYADFNSIVTKGQVLARLDPSLFQTQIEQARANLIRAQAELDGLRVALADAQTKLTRARELSARQLIPRTDLETAEVNVRAAEAQIRSAEAQVTQAQASLNQNQVNLAHTVIRSPIDGLVISRSVDVGQTVAASMQTPTLFVLAADLTKMQVVASLDESDVGRIRPKQPVTFRVDAYPNESFRGIVSQVRLEPKVLQNVVTYATVIDVPNDNLRLKPGMTATVSVEIARATDVLRVPNSALRFRPTSEMFAALGQPVPEPLAGRGEAAGFPPRAAAPQPTAPIAGNAAAGSAAAAPARDAGRGRPAGEASGAGQPGGGRFGQRFEGMSDEQRAAALDRMRARGFDPTATGDGNGAPRRRRRETAADGSAPVFASSKNPAAAPANAPALTSSGATTVDALFAPLARVESVGRAWRLTDGQLQPVRLRLGISDGQTTELIEGALTDGAELVTNIVIAGQTTRPAATTPSPFGQPGRGGFGGFGGRGGR